MAPGAGAGLTGGVDGVAPRADQPALRIDWGGVWGWVGELSGISTVGLGAAGGAGEPSGAGNTEGLGFAAAAGAGVGDGLPGVFTGGRNDDMSVEDSGGNGGTEDQSCGGSPAGS
ncbi:MAG: hypothetical protein ACRBK7_16230 [Acidimicrobiales bacterium]